MLSTYEMEATTEALEAGGQRFQLEALEERLAPCDCGGAAVALSTGAAVAISGDGGAAAGRPTPGGPYQNTGPFRITSGGVRRVRRTAPG